MCTETWIWRCGHLRRKDISCPKVAKERQRARSRCCWLWPAKPRNVCDKGKTHHHSYPCPECEEKDRKQQEHEQRRANRHRARQAASQQYWEQVPVRGSSPPPPPPPPKDHRTVRSRERSRGRSAARDSFIEPELYGQAVGIMPSGDFNRYMRPPPSTERTTRRDPKRGKSAVRDSQIEPELYRQAMSHLPPGDFSQFMRPPSEVPKPSSSQQPSSQRRKRERPPPLQTRSLGRDLTGHRTAPSQVSPVSPGESVARE